MARQYPHVVQLRLTHDEWRLLDEIAQLRRVSVEDLLREGLRLHRRDAEPSAPDRTRRLKILAGGEEPARPAGRRMWRRSERA